MLKQPDSDIALTKYLVDDFSFYDVVNSCSTYHDDRRSKIAKFSTNEAFIGYLRLSKIFMCTGMALVNDHSLILARKVARSAGLLIV